MTGDAGAKTFLLERRREVGEAVQPPDAAFPVHSIDRCLRLCGEAHTCRFAHLPPGTNLPPINPPLYCREAGLWLANGTLRCQLKEVGRGDGALFQASAITLAEGHCCVPCVVGELANLGRCGRMRDELEL